MVNPGSTSIASRPRFWRRTARPPCRAPRSQPVDPVGLQQGRRRSRRLPSGSGRAIWSKRRAALSRRGDAASALRVLGYLRSIQQPDGHWPQNAWLDGRSYWPGIRDGRMRLSAAAGRRVAPRGAPAARQAFRLLPMIERAATYVVSQRTRHRRGPLGRRCRLQPVHACRRDRRTACRGRPARRLRQG